MAQTAISAAMGAAHDNAAQQRNRNRNAAPAASTTAAAALAAPTAAPEQETAPIAARPTGAADPVALTTAEQQVQAEVLAQLAEVEADSNEVAIDGIGAISMEPVDLKRGIVRVNERDGSQSRMVAIAHVELNAHVFPGLTAPINIYRVLPKGAKQFTIRANWAGKSQGPGRAASPYFGTTSGALTVGGVSADFMRRVIALYKQWSKTEAARLIPALATGYEEDGGDASEFGAGLDAPTAPTTTAAAK